MIEEIKIGDVIEFQIDDAEGMDTMLVKQVISVDDIRGENKDGDARFTETSKVNRIIKNIMDDKDNSL